jgi:spore coat polysaccharide biosynthesis protein SpsF
MKVVAIIQARIGSTRLPGKVLLDLAGRTVLARCIERAAAFQGVAEVVVATTANPEDDLIVRHANRLGVRATRGSVEDVLSRYLEAARATGADAVVRCTSDNPLIDPEISSSVVHALVASQSSATPLDYAANNLERRLPLGLDLGVVTVEALARASRDATTAEREHVTLHVYRHPERFRLLSVVPAVARDCSSLRWTLDTLDDYRLLATVFERLGAAASSASFADVLRLFEDDPSLAAINSHIAQKVPV